MNQIERKLQQLEQDARARLREVIRNLSDEDLIPVLDQNPELVRYATDGQLDRLIDLLEPLEREALQNMSDEELQALAKEGGIQ